MWSLLGIPSPSPSPLPSSPKKVPLRAAPLLSSSRDDRFLLCASATHNSVWFYCTLHLTIYTQHLPLDYKLLEDRVMSFLSLYHQTWIKDRAGASQIQCPIHFAMLLTSQPRLAPSAFISWVPPANKEDKDKRIWKRNFIS